MEETKKIEMLEDLMELDSGTLKPETDLSSLDYWDSMTRLSLIVMIEDEFGKTIKGEQIRAFKTVKDVLDCMN